VFVKVAFAERDESGGGTLPEKEKGCVSLGLCLLCIINTVDDLWLEWHFVWWHHLVFQ